MSLKSRNKGKAGEREIAALVADLTGLKVMRRVRQRDGDSDLEGVPGWCIEVKRHARAARASSSRTIRAWMPRIISASGTWPRYTMAAKEPTSTTVEPVRTAKDFILEFFDEAGWFFFFF